MKAKYKLILLVPLVVGFSLLLKVILPKPIENLVARDQLWTKKTHSTKKFDILVIGDSRTYRGVSTEAMLEGTEGISAINLGYSGIGLDNFYMDFIQKRMYPEGRRIIVIGITPNSFTPSSWSNIRLKDYIGQDKVTIFKNMHYNRVLKYFNPYIPREIWDFTINARVRRGYYQEFMPDGWIKSYMIPDNSYKAIEDYKKHFKNNKVSEANVNCFLQGIKRWIDDGICVIGYRVPTTDKMVAVEDSTSGFNYQYIKESFQKSGGFWIEFDNNDFRTYDGSHLHFSSAEKLSRLLGEEIKRLCLLK